MRSKLMFLVLFSFAIVSCENIIDDDNNNGNNKDNRLLKTLQDMSKNIDKVETTNDPDEDFALKMKVHHRGAIDLANHELLRGDDEDVLEWADTIKQLHTMEIAKLDSFINAHAEVEDSVNGMDFLDEADLAMEKMDSLIKVRNLSGDTDHDFLVLMIEHHKSGVELTDAVLEFGKEEEFKAWVTKMKEDAEEEIAALQALLEEKY